MEISYFAFLARFNLNLNYFKQSIDDRISIVIYKCQPIFLYTNISFLFIFVSRISKNISLGMYKHLVSTYLHISVSLFQHRGKSRNQKKKKKHHSVENLSSSPQRTNFFTWTEMVYSSTIMIDEYLYLGLNFKYRLNTLFTLLSLNEARVVMLVIIIRNRNECCLGEKFMRFQFLNKDTKRNLCR